MKGFSEPTFIDYYKFTYKKHTFEIGVSYETIKVCDRGVRSEYQDNIFRFSCDKELYYGRVHMATWVALSRELRLNLQSLHELIVKHYKHYEGDSEELSYDSFLKLLPKDFKEKYLNRIY